MENPERNRITAGVFVRYLEKEFGLRYQAHLPQQANDPDFDVRLDSDEHESLWLQLKQPLVFESSENVSSRSKIRVFKKATFEAVVKKAAEKYKDKSMKLILILHVDDGYLIPWDGDVEKNTFANSIFRGIYVVSPELELRKAHTEPTTQDEFVSVIKSAF